MKPFVTLAADNARAEDLIIKRSRFIGSCVKIDSEDAARAALAEIQKEFWDAAHNCFAFVVDEALSRSSDAGEPSGTAGTPILEVLRAREIQGALVVVTRYFGGTLLGRGGLVSAYSKCAAMALDAAGTARYLPALEVRITVEYGLLALVESFLEDITHALLEKEYAENVRMRLLIPEADREEFGPRLVDLSNGRLEPEFGKLSYYAF